MNFTAEKNTTYTTCITTTYSAETELDSYNCFVAFAAAAVVVFGSFRVFGSYTHFVVNDLLCKKKRFSAENKFYF